MYSVGCRVYSAKQCSHIVIVLWQLGHGWYTNKFTHKHVELENDSESVTAAVGTRVVKLVVTDKHAVPLANMLTVSVSRIVASCTAWKSCAETNAETLFHSLSTCLHEMLQLSTPSQL